MSEVFITGASGALGASLIPKLVAAGYHITGLGRSPASVRKIESLAYGVKAIEGGITDLDICAEAASKADIVLHLAFDHEQAFSGDFQGACDKDVAITQTLLNALGKDGRGCKIFMIAAGVLGLNDQDEKTEAYRNPLMPRYRAWDLSESYASAKNRVGVIRLAPVTYSSSTPPSFIRMHMREAQRSGYFAYTDNHAWPACSYEDAAEAITLSILAGDGLENPANLHIVAETGVSHKVIAEALAERTGKKAKRIEEHGLEELGFLGKLMRLAYPVPSEYTRKATGWQPEGDGLVRAIMGYKLD